jgi:tetratricopeptide (TPR) repeat protein
MRGIWRAAALLAIVSSVARADEDRDAAKAHYARAIDFVRRGSHREAVDEFQQAYAAAPLPNILFNIGQEYRACAQAVPAGEGQIADLEAAALHYRRYLEARADAPDRAAVEQAIAEVNGQVATAKHAAAKARYRSATGLIESGKHREAIAEFEKAYALWPKPNILFNIGREYHTLGDSGGVADVSEVPDMKQAVAYYRRYLEARKDAPDRVAVEHVAGALEERIAEVLHPSQSAPPALHVAVAPVRSLDEDEGEDRRRRRTRVVVGATLGAVGVVAVVTAISVALLAGRAGPLDGYDLVVHVPTSGPLVQGLTPIVGSRSVGIGFGGHF